MREVSIHKNVQEDNISFRYKKYVVISIFLICLLFFSDKHGGINHAQIINPPSRILCSVANKEYTYNFKISDKLVGTGEVNLSVEDNEVKGTAVGFGMTVQCDLDFLTNIKGLIDTANGDIKVSVNGKCEPKGLMFPAKVSFEGPLKGFLEGKTVRLKGNVNIKGGLARMAGFRNKEDLIIEIEDTTLARSLNRIQNKKNLALYNKK